MTTSSQARRASLAGAIVAAIAASACCLVPAVLAIGGLSAVGFAAALEPYRPVFLIATAILLGIGFYLTYRRPTATAIECECERPLPRVARSARIGLWLSALLAIGVSAYPYLAAAGSHDAATGATADVTGATTTRFAVGGMTCEACSSRIVDRLTELDGVIRSRVDYGAGEAIVTYDPHKVVVAKLSATIERLGYTVSVKR